jgi:predicted phosphodiesterase
MSAYRIALVSDIHGNELALSRVLQDIRQRGVDQIACLGDVATLGPRPHEVLELVKEACDFRILGNHDEYMYDSASIREHSTSPLIVSTVEQCRSELSSTEIDFVQGFDARVSVPLAGSSSLLLFHGSPSSNNCDLVSETSDQDLAQHLGDQLATVMVGGHTHIQAPELPVPATLLEPAELAPPPVPPCAGPPLGSSTLQPRPSAKPSPMVESKRTRDGWC